MMAYRIDYTEMKRLRDSGMRNEDIAARLGCSQASVVEAAKRFGWGKKKPGAKRQIDVPLLYKLWHSEMETGDIALRLGVSLSTLHNVRQKHGLPKRPRAEVTLVADPTPDEIAERARQCRERHYAERRGETDETTLKWRQSGVA
jgi:uncharacterized protein YjcR